jgi:streptogramin lyase
MRSKWINRARAVAASTVVVLVAGTAPPALAATTITEYPIAGSVNPDQIAPGLPTDPAPSVWVTDPYGGPAPPSAGLVYRVDTATGKASGTFAPATGATVPTFIKPGPDGRMWTSDFNGTLMRAGSDGVFEKVGPDGYAHGGLSVGPDGNVWYVSETGGANTGQVGFIDPTTLTASDFDIPTANSHPNEITPGPPTDPNAMWFTEEDAARIGRVDTKTHVVTDYGGLTAGSRPNGIVVGSDGGLWFAEYGVGKIGRIDPLTHQVTEYGAPGELGGPDRMTVAPGGRIWFTLFDDSKIGSFVPGPNPTFDLIPTPAAGAQPSGITIGLDGRVWFAEYNNHAVAVIHGSYSLLPQATIDTGPSGTITATSATFTFHADDPDASFQCSLDDATFAACTSPAAFAGLATGPHTFAVRAVNGVGIEPNPPSRSFTEASPPPGPPVNTSQPAILQSTTCIHGGGLEGLGSCTPVPVPNTYECDPGAWAGTDPATPYTYEWQRVTRDSAYVSGYRYDTVATGQTFYAEANTYQQLFQSWDFRCMVTATGPGGQTQAISSTVTLDPAWNPLLSVKPTVDIHVTGIEVTQGVQTICCDPSTLPHRDLTNTTTPGVAAYDGVTLAFDKLTVVRVFAAFAPQADQSSISGVTATLRIYDADGNRLTTLAPVYSPATIGPDQCLCVKASQRAVAGSSFYFVVPWQYTSQDSLTFRATVDPPVGFGLPRQCATCKANSFTLTDVPFAPVVTVPVHPYKLINGFLSTGQSVQQVFGSAQTLLPDDLLVYPYAGAPIDVTPAGVTATSSTLARAAAIAAVRQRAGADGLKSSDFPIGVFVAGGLLDRGAETGPTLGSPGVDGPAAIVEHDRPLASVAHEIGHGLGLVHADTSPHFDGTPDCGGNSGGQHGESWPPDNEGRIQSIGLDLRNPNVFQGGALPTPVVEYTDAAGKFSSTANYYDIMSYCPLNQANESTRWLSARNWERLVAYRPPTQVLGGGGLFNGGPAPLHVIAIVDPAGAVSIFDVEPQQTRAAGTSLTSAYQVELRNAAGATVASTTAAATPIHVDGPAGQRPPLLLDAVLPFEPSTAAVVITAGGQQLARRNRTRNAPTVTILAPRPGADIGLTATTLVRWRANDPDGDRLTAAVDYSADGGRRWKVVADRITGGSARVPSRLLAAARDGRLRVQVSDGFDLTAATVTHLNAKGALPVVQILDVAHGRTVDAGSTLPLQGAAFDDAGAPLTGRRLRWYAGHRLVGTGERVTVTGLPAGTTTIRLVATDSHGRMATARLRVGVRAPAPAYLVAQAPAHLSPQARSVRITVASTLPATFTIAGKSYAVSRSPRTLAIAIRPGRSTLRLPCVLRSAGGTVRSTYIAAR